jgi:hypothetical protein
MPVGIGYRRAFLLLQKGKAVIPYRLEQVSPDLWRRDNVLVLFPDTGENFLDYILAAVSVSYQMKCILAKRVIEFLE